LDIRPGDQALIAEKVKSGRLLLVANEASLQAQLLHVLEKGGVSLSPDQVVPLGLAAERASRVVPQLMFVMFASCEAPVLQCVRELRAVCAARLCAIGPAHSASFILDALRAGADEYLDLAALDQEVMTSLAKFRHKTENAAPATSPGHVIGVIGASGGTGASFVAANVATALAQVHGSCGLIDLRLSAGDLSSLLNLRPQHTLADLCENIDRADQSMFDRVLAFHDSGVGLIAAPLDLNWGTCVTDRGVRQVLALARSRFQYVVVDVENRPGETFSQTVFLSDRLLLVTRLDFTSVRNAQKLLFHLEALGIEQERILLVANRYRQARELPLNKVQSAIGRKIDAYIYEDPSRVNRCVNAGKLLLTEFPRSSVAKQIRVVAQAVNGFCNGHTK
jgi:pilus assembly protein CpaE